MKTKVTSFFDDDDEVVIIDYEYNGRFKVVSSRNIVQSPDKDGTCIFVTIIEPLDVDAFGAFLFKTTGIEAYGDQEPIHVSIEPHRLQLAESLL
ncbi:hypothetical protein [Aliivibrio wodanis]|uniref:hypothetical protein n=1 Tax=Aliivibrio wodanis TaxID=80852 RepID=UPI00406D2678